MGNVSHTLMYLKTLVFFYRHTKFTHSDEIQEYSTGVNPVIYVGKTNQLMAPYWPDVAKNSGGRKRKPRMNLHKPFDTIDKVVVSRSLDNF